VAGLDHRLDGLGQRRLHAELLVLLGPRRVILEVLRVLRDLAHERIELAVDDGDEALRGSLRTARVAIDLDEAVREIELLIIGDPLDAEVDPVAVFARAIELDERVDHFGLSRLGVLFRLLEIADRLREVLRVAARLDLAVRRAGAEDFLHELAVLLFHEARVERVQLLEALDVLESHVAAIEVVRTRLDDVEPAARILRGELRLEFRIEDRRPQLFELVLHLRRGELRALRPAQSRERRLLQRLRRESRHELLRRDVVVIAVIRPEELRVVGDLLPRLLVARGMRRDQIEDVLLAERIAPELIVDDRIDRDRSAREPPDELLLARGQRLEPLCLNLDETIGAHAFHERALRLFRFRGEERNGNEEREEKSREASHNRRRIAQCGRFPEGAGVLGYWGAALPGRRVTRVPSGALSC